MPRYVQIAQYGPYVEYCQIKPEDLKRLSPYMTAHLKRYGEFVLDISDIPQRLNLAFFLFLLKFLNWLLHKPLKIILRDLHVSRHEASPRKAFQLYVVADSGTTTFTPSL
jgi:hypothetical protein